MPTFRAFKIYFHIFYYNFLAILTYPYELLITILEPAINIGFLTLFWSMISKGANKPVDIFSMVAYFILVEFVSIWVLNPSGLNFINFIGWRIKTGKLSVTLIRPVRPLPAMLFDQRGYYFVDMIFSILLLVIAIKLIGHVTAIQLIWFVVFLVLAFFITFSFSVLVGSLAFITKEINSIRHSVSHLARLLSGSLVPLTFFPEKMREILSYTPFPSMVFGPINILQNQLSSSELIFDLKVSFFWAITLFAFAMITWRCNIKKYEAVGL